MSKLLKFLNENHWQAITVVIVLMLVFWFYGCQSYVASLANPDKQVTRTMLQGEIDAYLALAKARMTTLDQQDALRKAILDNASVIASEGTFNPIGAINSVISILAIGSAVDSKRKLTVAKKVVETTVT